MEVSPVAGTEAVERPLRRHLPAVRCPDGRPTTALRGPAAGPAEFAAATVCMPPRPVCRPSQHAILAYVGLRPVNAWTYQGRAARHSGSDRRELYPASALKGLVSRVGDVWIPLRYLHVGSLECEDSRLLASR
jgi:hypothetical protein